MKAPMHLLLSIWPSWLACLLIPSLLAFFFPTHDIRFIALCCFLAGCTAVVTTCFLKTLPPASGVQPSPRWSHRIVIPILALSPAWAVLSAALLCTDPHDYIAPALALACLLVSLCIAPYFALALRRPLPAIVFTLSSIGAMKLLAGTINALMNGWHADTSLLWTHPNTITWAFLLCTTILCCIALILTRQKCRAIYLAH